MTIEVGSTGAVPVTVGRVANRLYSILGQHQTTLVNTAFSSVVREPYDLASAVFDSCERMIGQSQSGTPGHINTLATGRKQHAGARPPGFCEIDVDVTERLRGARD